MSAVWRLQRVGNSDHSHWRSVEAHSPLALGEDYPNSAEKSMMVSGLAMRTVLRPQIGTQHVPRSSEAPSRWGDPCWFHFRCSYCTVWINSV